MRRDVLDGAHFDVYSSKSNAGLWLDKFLRENDGSQEEGHRQPKTELVKQVAVINLRPEYRKFYERWQQTLEACGAQCREARVNECRLAIGVGAEGVLETSISLHHTYGVPFIPGSALKGLTASFARQRLSGPQWQKNGTDYRALFGDTTSAGFVTFFDALLNPAGGNRPLHADVLTVHHSEYYGGANVPPADWDTPIPVPFLSASGRYLMALAGPDDSENSRQWVQVAFRILQQALLEEGVGAKTSSGYGRMKLTF